MSEQSERIERLSPVKQALQEIRDLRARLATAEAATHEPIAIVGLGLRLPGEARDEQSFWQLLSEGRDAITEIPGTRWNIDSYFSPDREEVGKMTVRSGAFLDHVDLFDPEFFNISPREAESMDPQQRLLLEVAWEALEAAGQSPHLLAGTSAGVFIGFSNSDYFRLLVSDARRLDVYAASGGASSVAAGRLSYLLGIHGPSLTVDTACSSSLVSVHLACQSLRAGECSLALAGGVNLNLTPEINIALSKAEMLSPDGRCKTFDESANGYVRGEGCAVIVMKRMSDALASGNRILAVIRGSAVNQDGRSGGLTAPNGPAQEAVIREALANAGVEAREVSYVEAHGTGTSLGDPIEVQALGEVLCAGRSKQEPLYIGSVKTNIGHLEAAAGIAGLIKVVLSLQHREIPAHLHLKKKSSRIDWERYALEVPVKATEWEGVNGKRIAGVSSFGFSGTNAHVIVEEAPERKVEKIEKQRPVEVLTVSAKSAAALEELVGRYGKHLEENPGESLGDVAYTANVGRAHFGHRVAVVAESVEQAGKKLQEAERKQVRIGERPKIGFLFSGQGSQYAGMGRELYESSEVFRGAVDRCVKAVEGEQERPLLEVMWGEKGEQELGQTQYTQPGLYALEWGLAELWRSWGIEPSVVLGHSVGEYVAAAVAGVLGVEEGMKLVAARGRLMQGLGPGGAMLAVRAGVERVEKVIGKHAGRVSVAAVNGPESVVVSGWEESIRGMEKELGEQGVVVKRLAVSHGFHSPQMDAMLGQWKRRVEQVKFSEPRIRMITNVSGRMGQAGELTASGYWVRQVREAVQFGEGIKTAAGLGIRHFLEIGPQPVLIGMGQESLPGEASRWFSSLRRGRGEWRQMLEAVAGLYEQGAELDWEGVHKDQKRQRILLPTYPFQRRRFWMQEFGDGRVDAKANQKSTWDSVVATARRQSEQAPLEIHIPDFAEKWRCFEKLTFAYALQTLKQLGAFAMLGRRYGLEEILSETNIRSIYRNLLLRWLDSLCQGGLLARSEGSFVCSAPLPGADVESAWRDVEQALYDDPDLLTYTRICGDKLANVLTGKESALETLFPDGSFALAEGVYQRSASARYMHGIVAAAVESIAQARPSDKPLRILEIGAGTGSTTASLLPLLREIHPQYYFTDVSDFFLAHAAEKFQKDTFLRYGLFDVESPIDSGNFKEGSFDVILSTNAVHAAKNLGVALEHISRLLAPGGILILVEATRHQVWFDMTIGLIEGWQHFDDEWRDEQPLLEPEIWKVALTRHGFEEVRTFPESGSLAESVGQHVILAHVPGGASRTYLEQPERHLDYASRSLQSTPNDNSQHSVHSVPNQLLQDIQRVLPGEREDLLVSFVREEVMRTLRIDPSYPPERHSRLMDLGLDSLMAVQLRNRLTKALELEHPLPATLMFDHPTIEAIARFISSSVLKTTAIQEEAAPAPVVVEVRATSLRAEEIQEMSDTEAEEMLLKRLSQQ